MDAVDRSIAAILKREGRPVATAELGRLLAADGHSVSQPTLSRRLVGLVGARHVASRTSGRGLIHSWDNYHDWFSVPPQRRPKVGYDSTLLRDYEPNRSAWLSKDDIARLHDANGGRRLDGSTYARAIAQKLLVELSYASSALEGNTYSYLDTQVLIEFGQAADGKTAEETQMILNHKDAILYIVDNIADIPIDAREIKTVHALLARGLMADPSSVGAVRRRIVEIGGSSYIPLTNPHSLEDELREIARKAAAIDEPFEQSLFLLAFVSYLQAFEDVNKRTARLACNLPLLKAGLAPLSFLEMDKAAYIRGLLSIYELRRPDVLKDAFVGGYVRSASLYEVYATRDRASIDLEVRRGRDIYAAVREVVSATVKEGALPDLSALTASLFADDDEMTRSRLFHRVEAIVNSLQEGNHGAFGISRTLFDQYQRVRAAYERLADSDRGGGPTVRP